MRRSSVALVPLGVMCLLAACAGDRSTAPAVRNARSGGPSESLALTCNFKTTSSDANAFFAPTATGGLDPVFDILNAMQTAYNSGGAAAATDKGFDALRRLAAARGTSAQRGTGDNADAFTKDVLACMVVGAVPDGFNVAGAVNHGVYEVRGGATDGTGPALAYDASPGIKTAASPLWGIEAPSGWGATFGGNSSRYLLYATPLASLPGGETPSLAGFPGFDVGTIATTTGGLTLNSPVLLGVCIAAAGTGSDVNLLLHSSTSSSILAHTAPSFCSTLVQMTRSRGAWLASITRSAASFFFATPLFAQDGGTFFGGVGGLGSEFSPFGPVKITVTGVGLTFVQQPIDGKISAVIGSTVTPATPVKVKATTPSGNPITGVKITLTIINNNGQPANFFPLSNVAITDGSGIATFSSLQVTKAGGYNLLASGLLGGNSTTTVLSTRFNIQGK